MAAERPGWEVMSPGAQKGGSVNLLLCGYYAQMHVLDEMPHAFIQMNELSACRQGLKLMFDFMRRHV